MFINLPENVPQLYLYVEKDKPTDAVNGQESAKLRINGEEGPRGLFGRGNMPLIERVDLSNHDGKDYMNTLTPGPNDIAIYSDKRIHPVRLVLSTKGDMNFSP